MIIWPMAWRIESAPKSLPVSESPRACRMHSARLLTAGIRPAPKQLSDVAPTKSAWPAAGPASGEENATKECEKRSISREPRMSDMSKRIAWARARGLGALAVVGAGAADFAGWGLDLKVEMITGTPNLVRNEL